MRDWVLLAQKLFLTDKHVVLNDETREIVVKLLDYILTQDQYIEHLEDAIQSAMINLQVPPNVRRNKR